jgi:hypothetical protein
MFHAQELRPSGGGPGQSVSFPNISQGAVMASVAVHAKRTNRRMQKHSAAAAQTTKKRRRRRSMPLAAAAALSANMQVSVAPVPHSPSAPIEDQLDLLWSQIQSQMLELLTYGIAAPFQQRAFDKLDFSMKQYGKLRRERAEETQHARPAEPDAEELAAILNKIDRRIDELAEDRFKKLAGGKLPAPAMETGSAGMDV